MSEVTTPTPTPEASAGDQPAATPEGTPAGSEGGTQESVADGGNAFATERASLQAQIRTLQSDRDKARSELQAFQAPKSPASEGATEPPLTAARVAEIVAQANILTRTAEQLRSAEEFRHADPSIFDRSHEYSSPEALRVAAGESHAARAALYEAGFTEGQKAGAAPAPDPGPSGSSTGVPPTGLPSRQELADGGISALEKLRAEFPPTREGEFEYERTLDKILTS